MRWLDKVEEYLCAALIFFMAILAFANVIARYLTEQSLAFTEELVINLFVFATLLGASIAFRKGAHLGMTVLTDFLPNRYKKGIAVLSAVCGVALFVMLLFHGVNMVIQEYESEMTTYSMGLPMWWFGMAVPLGSVLVIGRIIQAALAELRALAGK
ncbi:TRAP transporter small permease [Sporolituus thermophilus]|uniref:TRAP-type C4-dicarboxylate transport system, small permease component n=1 Tax=Sporolituus thermophilus DSM 23256 TaxID=1123285 RepID=A0A1G7L7W7_9FIRM|nr:TRAP transporter small permease [Sporolituus thermophilus]SDF45466.1 TRAP-type C4-dicarboxylate transport system, small permease component [Sporolituus thermophilus DSM 23256]